MKKFIAWLEKWLPYVWAMLWVVAITAFSVGVAVYLVKWVLNLMGVAA